jgi:predicted nucleic acid-binding Zn ribbon protein
LSPANRSSGRSEEPQALGSVLDLLGAERRLAAGLSLGHLARSWEAVVGERLAAESAPAGLEEGVLLVRASSGAWAAQVRFLAKEIAGHANRVLEERGTGGERAARGAIREVRVMVEPGPATR